MKKSKIALSIVCILSTNMSFANSVTWSGTTNSDWSVAANWGGTALSGGVTPATLTFPATIASGRYISTYTFGHPISNLSVGTFAVPTANAYTIQGSQDAVSPFTILPIPMATNTSISIGPGGTARPTFNYLQANGSLTLTKANTTTTLPTVVNSIIGAGVSAGGDSVIFTTSGSPSTNSGFQYGQTIAHGFGANSYSGGTTITTLGSSAATLNIQCTAANIFPSATAPIATLTFNGGTLDLNAFNQAIDSITNSGGPSLAIIENTSIATTAALTIGSFTTSGNLNSTINGQIGPSGSANLSLTKSGTGTLSILNNTAPQNLYSHGTTLNGGTIKVTDATNLGSGTFVFQNLDTSGGDITLDFNITTTNKTFTNSITLNAPGTGAMGGIVISNTGFQPTLTGPITGPAGSPSLQLNAGSSTLQLLPVADSTYPGGTNLLGGTIIAFRLTAGTINALGYGPITFNGGNLTLGDQILASFTLSNTSPHNNILTMTQGGSIDCNAASVTLGDNMNTGADIITGSGVLTFKNSLSNSGGFIIPYANSSYSAGVVLSSGIVSIGNAQSLGTGIINLSGGELSPSVSLTLANGLNVTANSTINSGTGINTVLSNSVAGINSPILTLSGSGTTAINSVSVTDTGVFTISGNIAGSQALNIAAGSGTLNLPLASSYAGGTNLNSGILSVGDPASLGSGTLAMSAGTTLIPSVTLTLPNAVNVTGDATIAAANSANAIFSGLLTGTDGTTLTLNGMGTTALEQIAVNGTDAFVVSGGIGGSQPLTKTGTGLLTFPLGNDNQCGSVEVAGGELAVLGTLTANTTLTVDSGATLSGTGTVTGDVINNGFVAPGASPGQFFFVGNYIDNNTFVEAITPTIGAELFVTGNVIINSGTTFQIVPDLTMGAYTSGTTYTVIDATGSVTGKYQTLTSTAPLIVGTLSYVGSTVVLTLGSPPPVQTVVTGGNAGKVAAAIDAVNASGNTALKGIADSLMHLTLDQLISALNAMDPSRFKGLGIVQENNGVIVQEALTQRFQVVLDGKHCYDPCPQECEPDYDVNLWAAGMGDYLHQSNTHFFGSPVAGYRDSTGGIVTGADYNFSKYFYAGALAAYTHSHMKWNNQQGSGDINSGYGGLYFSMLGRIFYGNLSVIGAWSGYDAKRNIIYPGVSQTAKNNHHGNQILSHVDTGFNLGYKALTIRPFDSLDWIFQKESSFVEHGAGAYDLSVKSTRANMLRNELGLNLAASRRSEKIQTTIDGKVGWVREVRMSGKTVQSEFVTTDVPFTTIGFFPNRNLLSLGGSLTATTSDDLLTFTLYYNGVFGNRYSDSNVGGEICVAF